MCSERAAHRFKIDLIVHERAQRERRAVEAEIHMHFLVSAPPRADSSPSRWMRSRRRIERRFTSVRWPDEILLRHSQQAGIRGQSFSCSTLRTEVILQQATAAQANLTARPLHLRFPGLEKGRPWCFLPLRLPARSLTHSHTQTHT